MKKKLTGDPHAELINVMGKRLPDPAHFRSVISLHDKAVKTSTDRATTYANRAIAICLGIHTRELDTSHIRKCRADIDEALKINKELPVVQIAEGCYQYYCLKNYEKAIASFTNAFKKDPENYKPLFYLAMVYKSMGDWKNVKSSLDKISKFKIQNPLGLTNLGLCLEYLHDFDSALAFHQKSIQINPEWWAAYFNKFRTLLLKGNKTIEARRLLNFIIEKSGEEHLEYQIILDLSDGKYSDAQDKALKAKNKDFTLKGERYIYLGIISLLKDDQINAQKYFNTALKKLISELSTDPDNPDLHGLIGLAHSCKGNKNEAIAAGKKAIDNAKRNKNKILESDMILNLAKIYSNLNMQNEAIEIIEEVLSQPSLFSTKMLHHDPVWKPILNNDKLKSIVKTYDNKVLTF
jgi:tetratricopeptide (TPR) repeat protein